MIRSLVAVQLAGLIVLRIVQRADPAALDDLNGIGENHGTLLAGGFLQQALFQLELTFGHFILRLITGPGQFDTLFKGLRLIVHKVQSTFAVAQNVLSGVGRVAAAQQHGVVVLTGYIVGLHQRIRTQSSTAVLTQGADHHRGHVEEQRGLVEVVYHAQIFEAGHSVVLL